MKRIIVTWIMICLFCAACLPAFGEEIWLDDDSAYEVFDDDDAQFIDDEDTFDDDEDGFEFFDDDDGFEFIDDDDENGKAEADDFVLNLDDVKVGDIITLGRYPQNDDDPEPIEWIVLQKEGKRAFLLSKYVLDAIPYEESHDKVTWEECTLRAWLNDDFYYDSFSSAERAYIIETQINEQTDYIYLMNRSEAMVNYLHSAQRATEPIKPPTACARACGCRGNDIRYSIKRTRTGATASVLFKCGKKGCSRAS